MNIPAESVLVFETNETRADLYALWLAEFDVSVALTKQQADEKLDDSVAVAVLDQEFAGEETDTLLEIIRSRSPLCRVIATRDRSAAFPDLGADYQLVKPVFEEALVDLVETLLCRVNYHYALRLYYQTTVTLSSREFGGTDSDVDDETYRQLRDRSDRLQSFMTTLRERMTDDDVDAVLDAVKFDADVSVDSRQEAANKYRPDECSRCGEPWDERATGDPPVTRLGAYVWRCQVCGYVQMQADPSHQRVGSYRR